METLKWRISAAIGGIILVLVWFMPNLINTEKVWWPSKTKLNYGLDIQGGLHLVLGVNVDGVMSESANRLSAVLSSQLEKDGVPGVTVKLTNASLGEFEVQIPAPEGKAKVAKYIDEHYPTQLQKMSEAEKSITYRYFEAYANEFKTKVIDQAIETIRNRIDEFGVAEPSISRQGADRILVQLPGMADAEKAKSLINTTAKLDFMIVEDHDQAQLRTWIEEAEKTGNYNISNLKYSEYVTRVNKDIKGKITEGTLVYFEKAENAPNLETGKIPFLLRTDTNLSGDALNDAFVSYGQYGQPEVALRFNSLGASRFKQITGKNVGRRMAVVLDKVIKTAPNIQTEIGNGEAVITLGGQRDREKSMDEAKMISTALRAGALPAELEQLEERRIGPTLGSDSVKKAQLASWIGAILILIFMIARYRAMGVIANVCLAVNILSVLALLTSLGATLTLPGIAGIALTVGFAVDANVLIYERMREEIHKGSSFLLSIKEGYARAFSAIIDANITTAATAVVLLYFGTGPVRGFAVTLLVGIVTTLFANVFLSKVIVDYMTGKMGVKEMSV